MTKEDMMEQAKDMMRKTITHQERLTADFIRRVNESEDYGDTQRRFLYTECKEFIRDYDETEKRMKSAWDVISALEQID